MRFRITPLCFSALFRLSTFCPLFSFSLSCPNPCLAVRSAIWCVLPWAERRTPHLGCCIWCSLRCFASMRLTKVPRHSPFGSLRLWQCCVYLHQTRSYASAAIALFYAPSIKVYLKLYHGSQVFDSFLRSYLQIVVYFIFVIIFSNGICEKEME